MGLFDGVQRTIAERADQLVRALVQEADHRLRLRSPVDTGRFRGNWYIAQDVPDDAEQLGPFPTGPAAPRAVPPDVRAGGVTYITNTVPYAEELEYGRSQQAPGGMVRITAAELAPLAEQIATRIEVLGGERG